MELFYQYQSFAKSYLLITYIHFRRQGSRRSLNSLTLKKIKEGIWKCRREDLDSVIGCRTNKECPCGEYCDLKNRRCKRASCNKEAKGGRLKNSKH